MFTLPRVVISGGSGFIGSSLARYFVQHNYSVTVLSRSKPRVVIDGVNYVDWDARTPGEWVQALNKAEAIVNLAGRSVDCIKTPENCDEILRSRIESTRALGLAQRNITSPPKVWVQMSTAHIYGDPATQVCDETSAFGYGLAPTVGQEWETQYRESVLPGQRSVILRTSFVIGKDRGNGGGAVSRLKLLCKLGLGGRVGHGRQGFSWIHEEDMNRIFLAAITREDFAGAYIASSPNPVPQALFMQRLRKVSGGLGGLGVALPAPGLLVMVGAPVLMRTDPQLAIYGRYVVPKRLIEEHKFTFTYADLTDAIANVI